MTDARAPQPAAPRAWPRRLGHVRGAAPGPLLVTIGGIHGNEPAGLLATERALAAPDLALTCGDWVALSGNRAALARGVRFVDRDLNRGWSDDALARLACDAPEARDVAAEDAEQRELWAAVSAALAAARGPAYVLDLHTTSADGFPFAVAGKGEAARAFALAFDLPLFLGLMDRLAGALVTHLAGQGVIGAAVEGGQNGAPVSVDRLEAAIHVALAELGLAPDTAGERTARAHALLARARAGLPHAIEIVERHPVAPGDGFRMEPGFANIQPIRAGTLIARDRTGEIRAREDGLVVMPLYQGQGDDGFFLGRAVQGL